MYRRFDFKNQLKHYVHLSNRFGLLSDKEKDDLCTKIENVNK